MTFINFDSNYKLNNLKDPFHLSSEVSAQCRKMGIDGNKIYNNLSSWTDNYKKIVDNIVELVKVANSAKQENKCTIDLSDSNASSFSQNQLQVVARALSREFGIELIQVNDLDRPNSIVVSWNRDNPVFTTSMEYLQQARKNGFLIDYHLKLGNKSCPIHKLVLASRSPYFDRLFRAGFKEMGSQEHSVAVNGVNETDLELFIDYIYTGNVTLDSQSSETLDNLIALADFYQCFHLKEMCMKHMCKVVSVENFADFIQIARGHHLDELETALVKNVKKEIKLENFEDFVLLARKFEIPKLEAKALSQATQEIVKQAIYKHDFAAMREFLDRTHSLQHPNRTCAMKYDIEVAAEIKKRRENGWDSLNVSMLRQYLEIAAHYQLPSLREECQFQLIEQLSMEKEEPIPLDEIKLILKLASQFQLQGVLDACEEHLIERLPNEISEMSTFNIIKVLASQFKLARLQESCAAIRG